MLDVNIVQFGLMSLVVFKASILFSLLISPHLEKAEISDR